MTKQQAAALIAYKAADVVEPVDTQFNRLLRPRGHHLVKRLDLETARRVDRQLFEAWHAMVRDHT